MPPVVSEIFPQILAGALTTKYVLSSSTSTPVPWSSLPSACDQVETKALLPE